MLSQIGKEILIKAVAQIIPTYTMRVFQLPDTLCDGLTSMVCTFWWRQSNGKNRMAWLSWDKMCAPKKDGGHGFRDLRAFNLALLSKQGWRLQTNTHSLVYCILKSRYFPNSDFLHAELGQQPSYTWRSLMAAQHIVDANHCWQVGDGTTIQVWRDRRVSKPSTFCAITLLNTLHIYSAVSKLIDEATSEWKAALIKQIFLRTKTQTILSILQSHQHTHDLMVQAYTPKGSFTVNSAYKVAITMSPNTTMEGASINDMMGRFWRKFWSLDIPNKLKAFAWKASHNILL